jgi:hypothetical protein
MRPEACETTVPDGGRAISPGTPKIAFIALKNLQNPHVCHVLM